MKKIKDILLDNSGSAIFNLPIVFFVLLVILLLFLSVVPVFNVKLELDHFANEIVRVAEIEGEINSDVNDRIDELEEETGLYPDIEWSTSGKIDMGESFNVTLTDSYDFSFFIFKAVPVPLKSFATGKGEVYWKS